MRMQACTSYAMVWHNMICTIKMGEKFSFSRISFIHAILESCYCYVPKAYFYSLFWGLVGFAFLMHVLNNAGQCFCNHSSIEWFWQVIDCVAFLGFSYLGGCNVCIRWYSFVHLVDCMSVKMLTGNAMDGQYFINISGRDTSLMELSIYCRNMNTDSPLEYLTLPSGPLNNYVSVSDSNKCSMFSNGKYGCCLRCLLI